MDTHVCTLKSLCTDDKQKVAQLIRQVVDLGEQLNQLKKRAQQEKADHDAKVTELKKTHKALLKENASYRAKLEHVLGLLCKYQSRVKCLDSKLKCCNRQLPSTKDSTKTGPTAIAGHPVNDRAETANNDKTVAAAPTTDLDAPEPTGNCAAVPPSKTSACQYCCYHQTTNKPQAVRPVLSQYTLQQTVGSTSAPDKHQPATEAPSMHLHVLQTSNMLETMQEGHVVTNNSVAEKPETICHGNVLLSQASLPTCAAGVLSDTGNNHVVVSLPALLSQYAVPVSHACPVAVVKSSEPTVSSSTQTTSVVSAPYTKECVYKYSDSQQQRESVGPSAARSSNDDNAVPAQSSAPPPNVETINIPPVSNRAHVTQLDRSTQCCLGLSDEVKTSLPAHGRRTQQRVSRTGEVLQDARTAASLEAMVHAESRDEADKSMCPDLRSVRGVQDDANYSGRTTSSSWQQAGVLRTRWQPQHSFLSPGLHSWPAQFDESLAELVKDAEILLRVHRSCNLVVQSTPYATAADVKPKGRPSRCASAPWGEVSDSRSNVVVLDGLVEENDVISLISDQEGSM